MSFLNELQNNFRLRIGLAVIIAIFGVYGLLEWRDHNLNLRNRYQQLATQAARLNSQQAQVQWPMRASEVRAELASLESRLWRQPSLGLAQAELQDWLYAQLRQADAKNYSVKVADASARLAVAASSAGDGDAGGMKLMRARIELNADTPVLLALLAALADADRQIVVDTLNMKAQRVEIGVSSWYAAPVLSKP